MNKDEALKILDDIRNHRWGWLKIKRFNPDDPKYVTSTDLYEGLQKHHEAETSRMLEVIKSLCELIESQP